LTPRSSSRKRNATGDTRASCAYSKICTHVGCPVGLYEQQTHHLLCPCHQSTFDVTDDCKVIFGPAKRALPQLKIAVDDEGYLVSHQSLSKSPSARASGSATDEYRDRIDPPTACASTTSPVTDRRQPGPRQASAAWPAGWTTAPAPPRA
jgi:nitrite reductase/ring-hydroxylating ferredoxin subunit